MARARAPRDAAVQHCLEYLGSEHPDFELDGGARLVVQFEGVLPEAAPCVAYAPIDLDEQVSIVVDVAPEVYELVRLVECGGGLRQSPLCVNTSSQSWPPIREAKRRAHDHDHPHHLSRLLGGLRDAPGIVSVKHAPKQRRQDWLSGNCFPPPPPPFSSSGAPKRP